MAATRYIRGTMLSVEDPVWGPLERLLDSFELCGDFVWMFAVALKDGRRMYAYKHHRTRCYLHVAEDGRAYVYCDNEKYREVSRWTAVSSVYRERDVDRKSAGERKPLDYALQRALDLDEEAADQPAE